MKKVFSISLVMLMALCVFISCNPSSGVEDNVSVTLNAKNGEIELEKENLSWKYTAVKSDGLDPKDGETEEEKALNNSKTDPLSQGEWNFTLNGYKGSNLVCTGSAEKVEITKTNNTVDIDVSLLQKAEGTIVVSDDVAIKSTDGKTTYSLLEGYTMTLVISDKDGNVVTRKEYHSKAVFNTDSQTVTSGAYSITVTFSKDDVTATYTKNINVYDYLSTTISGSLNGVIIKADADKGGTEATTVIEEDVFETKTNEKGEEVVENAKVVEVVAPITATEESSTAETKETTVAFPAGSLKKTTTEETTEAVTLTVAAATATAASASTSDYSTKITTTDAAVVAGFEFNLSGADSSDLTSTQTTEDGKEEEVGVTVTTYVAKGLGTKDNLKIEYIGETEGKDPEIVSYDSTTGKLVFTVYHFSKYAIVSTNIVAQDSNGNVYTSLKDAVAGATTGATVTLLKNIADLSSTVDVERSLTLDLNGHVILSSVRAFFVKNGILTLQNGTVVSTISNNVDSSAIRVSSNTAYSGAYTDEPLGLAIKSDAVVIGARSYGVTAFGVDDAVIDVYGKIYSANACISGNGTKAYTGKITVNVYSTAELTAYGASLTYSNGSVSSSTADVSTYKDACGIYQPNVGGELNVYGGKITSKTFSAVEVRNGVANIKGGILESEACEYNADCKNGSGDGPTTTGAAVALNYYGIGVDTAKDGAVVRIEGGTFKGDKELVVVNPRKLDFGDATVKAVVTGVSLNDEKVIGVKVDKDAYYPTLESAISNLKDNSTIKLLNDIECVLSDSSSGSSGCDERLYIYNSGITLDFGGHKLIIKSNYGGSYNTMNIFGTDCTVKNGEILAFRKTQGSNVHEVTEDDENYDENYPYWDSYSFVVELEEGKCTIESMTLYGVALYGCVEAVFRDITSSVNATNYYALYQEGYAGNTTVIEGGTFTSNVDGAPIFYNEKEGDTTIIKGGNYMGDLFGGKGKLVITGGTFTVDPSKYVDTSSYVVTKNVEEGSTSWTVSAK